MTAKPLPRYVRRWRLDGLALALALATLAASMVVASHGVSRAEASVFHAVNDLPEWMYRPMWVTQFLGVLVVPAVVAALALIFRRWRLATALLMLIPLKLILEKGVVKNLVHRDRPGTSVCDKDLSCLHLRGAPWLGESFPSGHVVIICGIAWLVAPYVHRAWRFGLVFVCVAVALARIYLGAHNPLDVVAGAACGVIAGAVLNLMVGVPESSGAEPSTNSRESLETS